ncbi:Conserved_hypothetical protein [Hexamita inflata]|uniref:Uncharacterized protein n=1 Tax=Hexamita inflata TaxID=28002 RepID=A0AA86PNE1_9EUKA|nr:Conserved hypothetical protein [Hexamita inflata]
MEQKYDQKYIDKYQYKVKWKKLCITDDQWDSFYAKNGMQSFAFVDQLGVEELVISNCQTIRFDRVPIKLKQLHVNNSNISEIDGVQNITDLVVLDLSCNTKIEHIKCLQQMYNLTILNLSHNFIENIEPLRKLTSLNSLYLNNNSIVDVSALAYLAVNLKHLDLRENYIVSAYPLRRLVNLISLHVEGNEIIDISPICPIRFKSQEQINDLLQMFDTQLVLFSNKQKHIFCINEQVAMMNVKVRRLKLKQYNSHILINKSVQIIFKEFVYQSEIIKTLVQKINVEETQ